MNDDERLKEGFAKLRADDARRAPAFEAMVRARPRRRSPWTVVATVAPLAAAAAVLVFWCQRPSAEMPQSSAVAVAPAPALPPEDPAPLDFLLDLPLGTAMTKVPDFDKSLLRGGKIR